MTEAQILEKLGLTKKQAAVYLSLLELGEATMSQLANHATLKRPTAYLIIDELDLLGLVSEVTKGKKKIYSAVHPKRIGELFSFRQNQFQEILPTLIAKYGTLQGKPKIQMLEGMDGLMHAYEEAFDLLGQEKEGLWIGNIELLLEKYPEVLRQYERLLKRLRQYRVREIVFGGPKTKKWVKEMNAKNPSGYKAKFLDLNSEHPATDQLIIANKTMIFSLKNEIFTLIIESEEIAKTNRAQFEQIWKTLS